jgi:hypothetical protein
MGLTYILRNGDLADSFCERLTGALPADTLAVRQLPCRGSNISKLYIERPQEPDLYSTVTATLRAKVPWDLWSSVITLDIDPKTAEAIAPTPLFGAVCARS